MRLPASIGRIVAVDKAPEIQEYAYHSMLQVGIISLVGLLLGCAPAFAANQTVSATSTPSPSFVDKQVTIVQGESVTWNNAGGNHNVHFDDGSFDMPMMPSSMMWSVSRTFQQTGTYGYRCELHGGSGMSGTVVVNASGGGSPPSSPPGAGGPPSANPGNAEPVSSLSGPSTQDVDKLYVRASMNEAGALTATGSVNVPGAAKVHRFKRVTRAVSPNAAVKLRLKLATKSLRAVKRGLRRKRLRAKVTVTAQDSAGKRTTRKRTIRLTN